MQYVNYIENICEICENPTFICENPTFKYQNLACNSSGTDPECPNNHLAMA